MTPFRTEWVPARLHARAGRETITEERLDREVRLAGRPSSPGRQGSVELYENNVLPYAVVNEPRDEWREQFHHLFAPLVSPCKTGREAALAIASLIQKTLNVRYSTERRVPHQGVKESLQSGKVSCTGQSILLICALRSVGIPARMAGVLTWNHVRGNHNWVEAWCDGEWKMLEYNEKDFNTPWVMSAISMLDPRKPENAIYATSWKKEPSGAFFPMIWEARYDEKRHALAFPPESRTVPAVRITDRYMKLASDWVAAQPEVPAGRQADAGYQGWEGRRRQKTAPARRSQVGRRKVLAEGTTPAHPTT
ncbi:MAG: transglutaminase-like domain-containing protein [Akkermansia sp.]